MNLRAKKPTEVKPKPPQVLIYGPPGSGKTWFAISARRPYVIDCERSASNTSYMNKIEENNGAYFGPDDGADIFEEVVSEVESLIREDHEFGTLVIDGFSSLFNRTVQAEHERLTSEGKTTAFGADKKPAVHLTRKLFRRLTKLNMSTMLICHSVPEYSDGEVVGQAADVHKDALYDVHIVLESFVRGRSFQFRVIKSRYPSFAIHDTFDNDFQTFKEKFNV